MLGIVTSKNEFCKNPTSKDTITAIYSESYGSIGGHKHSLDQDTKPSGPEPKIQTDAGMGTTVTFTLLI